MKHDQFAGDKKLPMKSLLARPERWFIDKCVPHFPRSIEGYHLTLCTILWSAGVILFGYLARRHSIHWLWGASLMLFMQWFTDSFDGSLGRYRDTGIPKWGYYMDHFLDYVFMCALAVGYMFLVDGAARSIILILVLVYGAFMTSVYLAFAATNEFKITYLGCGPTEMRLLFIALNTALILAGARGIELLAAALPYFLAMSLLVLCFVVFRTQKYIWRIDMDEKVARVANPRNGCSPGV